MPEVICIQPSMVNPQQQSVTRVAAYCRVSSLPQEESYASQVEHFTSFIGEHRGWKLVEVYGDEGLSGLNTKNRTGFKKMLRDGKARKFDLLLVKSISRLGRNTVDLLESVRALKAAGVVCYFEKENLSTDGNGTGELMLTLLSAFAQMESESISANVRIGLSYRMKRGEWSVAYSNFLGYDRVDGEIVVNLEGAATVRMIYEWFLSGMSLARIARKLKESHRKTGTGNTNWTATSVKRILQNRKYCGDVVLQQTVVTDLMNKKRAPNKGQAPVYLVVDGIPPIITRHTFFLAQGELERRSAGMEGVDVRTYKNGVTGKLKCTCGGNYNKANARGAYIWKCYNRVHGDCTGKIYSEAELQQITLQAVQELYDSQPEIVLQEETTLTSESSAEERVLAAKVHISNVFLSRVDDIVKGKRPEVFAPDLLNAIARIDIVEDGFRVLFHNGSAFHVERIGAEPIKHKSVKEKSRAEDYVYRFNVTGEERLRLVRRLESLMDTRAKYMKFPSMAYTVGDHYVSKNGTVEGRLSKKILKALKRSGFEPST